jgi:hypothetical protein
VRNVFDVGGADDARLTATTAGRLPTTLLGHCSPLSRQKFGLVSHHYLWKHASHVILAVVATLVFDVVVTGHKEGFTHTRPCRDKPRLAELDSMDQDPGRSQGNLSTKALRHTKHRGKGTGQESGVETLRTTTSER